MIIWVYIWESQNLFVPMRIKNVTVCRDITQHDTLSVLWVEWIVNSYPTLWRRFDRARVLVSIFWIPLKKVFCESFPLRVIHLGLRWGFSDTSLGAQHPLVTPLLTRISHPNRQLWGDSFFDCFIGVFRSCESNVFASFLLFEFNRSYIWLFLSRWYLIVHLHPGHAVRSVPWRNQQYTTGSSFHSEVYIFTSWSPLHSDSLSLTHLISLLRFVSWQPTMMLDFLILLSNPLQVSGPSWFHSTRKSTYLFITHWSLLDAWNSLQERANNHSVVIGLHRVDRWSIELNLFVFIEETCRQSLCLYRTWSTDSHYHRAQIRCSQRVLFGKG